ncbi:MAG: hypothetical protein HeimC3_49030 [Candidatus Heimdallarchaeota archaeon LC_3]|nr:MAG: hypothetical protein HeimC3_49030 [Candidatus Heimdallarchaeota archaeon LC_3]
MAYSGANVLNQNIQKLTRRYIVLFSIQNFLFLFSSTFLILFLGDSVGLATAGFLISVSLLAQGLLDFPMGVLSDTIGQKYVLFASWVFGSLAYVYIYFDNSFETLILFMIFLGVQRALFSGTFETWYDNNYKELILEQDNQRIQYSYIFTRVQTFSRTFSAFGFLIGGYIAFYYSRQLSFLIQGILGLIFAIVVLFTMNDYVKMRIEESETSFLDMFFTKIKEGVKFFISSKKIFFFILTLVFVQVMWTVWSSLLLFIMYFGYTGSDDLAGTFRTVIFFTGIPMGLLASSLSKKVKNLIWLPVLFLLQPLFFFGLFTIITFVIPMTNTLNFDGLLAVWLVFTLITALFQIGQIMFQRLLIEFIPNEIRNSIYSLVPTIVSIVSFPFLVVAGYLIENVHFSAGILFNGSIGIISALCILIVYLLGREELRKVKL